MYNIYQSLKNTATKFPEKVAMVDVKGIITYNELYVQAQRLKEELVGLGVCKGTGVGLLTNNNRNFLIGLYASAGAGALVMPIFHQQQPSEITTAVKEAQLHLVLGDFVSHMSLFGTPSEFNSNSEFNYIWTDRSKDEMIASFVENPAFMRFTSGTTGRAKGVVLSHESVLERIETANDSLKIEQNDVILWVFPMAYHFVVSLVLYVHYGVTVVVNNDFLAESIIKSIEKYNVTLFYCSPMHIKLLAAYQEGGPLKTLKTVISTTTGVSADACRSFKERYNIAVHQAFGIIEVGLPIINKGGADAHPDAVGNVIDGYEAIIINHEGEPVGVNEVGLLGLKGPGMFDAYLSPPRLRNDILQDGWFMTGDLAVMDKEGLITIKGRKKDVIIVHGNKVFPNEVEEVLGQIESITKSKVYGKSHPLLGEVVVADVIIKAQLTAVDIQRFCRQKLSAYKVPQFINFVDSIEMTASGKIKRV